MALSRQEILDRIARTTRRLPRERLVEVLDFVRRASRHSMPTSSQPARAEEEGRGLVEQDGVLVFDAVAESNLTSAVAEHRERRLQALRDVTGS